MARVQAADDNRRAVTREAESRAAAFKAEIIREAEAAEFEALTAALALGLSYNRLGVEGMRTKAPQAVKNLMNRVRPGSAIDIVHQTSSEAERFEWVPGLEPRVKIRYPLFPTTSQADDYPGILEGIVGYNASEQEWFVVVDNSDQETEAGFIPGHLRWELESDMTRTLAGMLDEFAGRDSDG